MDPGVKQRVNRRTFRGDSGAVRAFGDSYNDIPMLEWAGLGVAMENARPEVKAAADRVAPRNDEDGVAQVLDELFGPRV